MKLPSCPRTLIISILRKHPDGLTLTSIAELVGLHRHTATKYIYELKGAGAITERDVGSAKLCYLKEGLGKAEEKKLIQRLNGKMKGLKSSAGQAQILTLFLVLFLVPASVIIAQNATINSSMEGNLVLDASTSNLTEAEFQELNQTIIAETPVAEIAAVINVTKNESSQLQAEINSSEVSQEASQNEEEYRRPELSINLSYTGRIARGEPLKIEALIANSGGEARNVMIKWILPAGFQIAEGNGNQHIEAISSNASIITSITVSTDLKTPLGPADIKAEAHYE